MYRDSRECRLIAAVKAHANEHYNEDGWDVVVEALNDNDIAIEIGGARSEAAAIRNVRAFCKIRKAYADDIRAAGQ